MSEDNVLFVRNIDEAADDVWDDSALIKAYDKAINLAKEEVSKRLGVETEKDEKKQKKSQSHKQNNNSKTYEKKWKLNDACRAVYAQDGEIYEAVILNIDENKGVCLVRFIGYNNTELVQLTSLLPSEGLQSQMVQQSEAAIEQKASRKSNCMDFDWPESSTSSSSQKLNGNVDETMDCEISESKMLKNMYGSASVFNPALDTMPPAPPLPPQLMARLPENDSDALSSMLMSWYISGFHTGYYHGLKQGKKKNDQKKK